MKKKLNGIIALGLASLCLFSCGEKTRKEIRATIVDATCQHEGYIEHEYDDGYICRDTFTPLADHSYKEVKIGTEEAIVYNVCEGCGKLKYEFKEVKVDTHVVIDYDREKPVFTDHEHMACAMIIEKTVDDAIVAIRTAELHGAHGFMVYVTALDSIYWTKEDLERIFYCTNLPVLSICYNVSYYEQHNITYEMMDQLLTLSVQSGACAVDMPAYLFNPNGIDSTAENKTLKQGWADKGFGMSFVDGNVKEVTLNQSVLDQQKAFADKIHGLGAEVLLSCHASANMDKQQMIDLAEFLGAQDIDVVKIVDGGSSDTDIIEELAACMSVKNMITKKFSIHGQSVLSRMMCPMFGSYIAFCVDKYTTSETSIQIDLATMIAILESPELSGKN